MRLRVNQRLAKHKAALHASDPHCAYCRKPLTLGQAKVDHVLPKSRGGSNRRENLALCCKTCNLLKGARTVEEWKAGLQAGLFSM